LVVPGRIEREVSKQFPVIGDHANVEPFDQQRHPFASVRVPDADVVKPRAVAKRDLAALVDPIPSDPDPSPDADPRT
jgi:hypothetical protein